MNNQAKTTPPQQPPQPVISSNTPSSVTPSPIIPASRVRKALDKIMVGLKFIQRKISSVKQFAGEGTPSITEISQRTKRIATSVAALFLTLITLIIVLTYFKNRSKVVPVEEKKDGGAATTIVERKPSRYASDEAVLKIETDVKTLENEIGKIEIEEKNLIPPSLNFSINFEE
jgi:hypothetical protein